MNLEKEFIMNAIKNYILSDRILKNNVISIYSMGSFAKNDIFSDVDLNFFVKTNILPSFISSNYSDLIEENWSWYDCDTNLVIIFVQNSLFFHSFHDSNLPFPVW